MRTESAWPPRSAARSTGPAGRAGAHGWIVASSPWDHRRRRLLSGAGSGPEVPAQDAQPQQPQPHVEVAGHVLPRPRQLSVVVPGKPEVRCQDEPGRPRRGRWAAGVPGQDDRHRHDPDPVVAPAHRRGQQRGQSDDRDGDERLAPLPRETRHREAREDGRHRQRQPERPHPPRLPAQPRQDPHEGLVGGVPGCADPAGVRQHVRPVREPLARQQDHRDEHRGRDDAEHHAERPPLARDDEVRREDERRQLDRRREPRGHTAPPVVAAAQVEERQRGQQQVDLSEVQCRPDRLQEERRRHHQQPPVVETRPGPRPQRHQRRARQQRHEEPRQPGRQQGQRHNEQRREGWVGEGQRAVGLGVEVLSGQQALGPRQVDLEVDQRGVPHERDGDGDSPAPDDDRGPQAPHGGTLGSAGEPRPSAV